MSKEERTPKSVTFEIKGVHVFLSHRQRRPAEIHFESGKVVVRKNRKVGVTLTGQPGDLLPKCSELTLEQEESYPPTGTDIIRLSGKYRLTEPVFIDVQIGQEVDRT